MTLHLGIGAVWPRQETTRVGAHVPSGVVALQRRGRDDRPRVSGRRADLPCARRDPAAVPSRGGHRRATGDDAPASQIVHLSVPLCAQEDPSLARVLSEPMADCVADEPGTAAVGEVLPAPSPGMAITAKSAWRATWPGTTRRPGPGGCRPDRAHSQSRSCGGLAAGAGCGGDMNAAGCAPLAVLRYVVFG